MCEQWVLGSLVDEQTSEKDWRRCSDVVAKSKKATKLYRPREPTREPAHRASLTTIVQIVQIWRLRRSPTLRAYDRAETVITLMNFTRPREQTILDLVALITSEHLGVAETKYFRLWRVTPTSRRERLVQTILQSWPNFAILSHPWLRRFSIRSKSALDNSWQRIEAMAWLWGGK